MENCTQQTVEEIVLRCMENTNLSREPDEQLLIHPQARIFGGDSTLDSLGLVSLLIDIEDTFADQNIEIRLSDDRAMSQKRSPYRDVPTLVAYLYEQIEQKEPNHS